MNGAVFNAFGSQISNPQGVDRMVAAVRGREGGRFRVTPEFGLVLVWQPSGEKPMFFLAGRIEQPFKVVSNTETNESAAEVAELAAGDDFHGPADKKGGNFKVAQRAGGLIERKVSGGAEVAQLEGTGNPDLEGNARKILEAWESLGRSFSRFFVNSLGHAWYEAPSGRKFLGVVKEGFSWPNELGEGQ